MVNKYQIRIYLSNRREFVDISKKEYLKIKLAKNNLYQALFIEEKLDLVLENFFEFENILLNTGLKHIIFKKLDPISFHEENRIINRNLVNLLSASKLYVDHISHHISYIYGKSSNQFIEVNKFFSEQYNGRLSYKVVDALRNYVQHRGFPIHKTSFSMAWENDGKLRYMITPYIIVSKLEDDEKFNKCVLKKLMEIGEDIDIRPFLRDYISCIGTIHEKIREILKDNISDWEATIQSAIDRYKKKVSLNMNIEGLAALILTESEKMIGLVDLSKDQIEFRRELENKNSMLDSMLQRYVTSEIDKN